MLFQFRNPTCPPWRESAIGNARHAALCCCLLTLALGACQKSSNEVCERTEAAGPPRVVLLDAPQLDLPGVDFPETNQVAGIDCNNPAHWSGDKMFVFSSTSHPYRTSGPDLEHLSRPSDRTSFHNDEGWKGGRWIESTYKDESGLLYGWYHHEAVGVCPDRTNTTAPNIGAAVSKDDGMHWQDLGIIMQVPTDSFNCASTNDAFSGGNGDFCVILDHAKKHFYIYFGNYHKDIEYQGVCAARMKYADRDAPVGKVWKWHEGKFKEPGIHGQVTPFIRTTINWHTDNANSHWGPAIHWNTYLNTYVMLLNRAKNKNWNQEGVYISYHDRLDDPEGWTKPLKILEGVHYYPQVIGTDTKARETDKIAGRKPRLFVTGKSRWEIQFLKPGEEVPSTAPAK